MKRPNKIHVGDWSWTPTVIIDGVNGYIEVKASDLEEADKKSYLLGNGLRMYNCRSEFQEVKKGVWRSKTFGTI